MTSLIASSVPSADSSWFYSSFSQVTGAIVGFVGGFLILRLQTYITDWGQLLARLESGQTQWALTSDRFHTVEGGEEWHPELSVEKNQHWADLMRALRERDRARMPTELLAGGLLLLVLLVVGVLWPLMALDAPSDRRKIEFLLPWTLLILAFVGVMYWRARATLAELREFKLRGWALAQFEEQERQEEAWFDRDLDKLASTDPVMRDLLDAWPGVRHSDQPFEAAARMVAILQKRFGHGPPFPEVGLTRRRARMLRRRRQISPEERDDLSSAAWQMVVGYFRSVTDGGD